MGLFKRNDKKNGFLIKPVTSDSQERMLIKSVEQGDYGSALSLINYYGSLDYSNPSILKNLELISDYLISTGIPELKTYAGATYSIYLRKPDLGIPLCRQAYDEGDATAALHLSMIYGSEMDLGIERSPELSFQWLMKAGQRCVEESYIPLATAYLRGVVVEKDYQEVKKWAMKAINAEDQSEVGDAYGIYGIACAYDGDNDTALQYIENAASLGSTYGLKMAGDICIGNDDVEQAIKYYKLGVQRGVKSCADRLKMILDE